MHDGATHLSQMDKSFPFSLYILADGPPKSDMYPLKSCISVTLSTSAKMDFSERLAINFPWCAEIVQKLHPPKQPLCILIENLIIS